MKTFFPQRLQTSIVAVGRGQRTVFSKGHKEIFNSETFRRMIMP